MTPEQADILWELRDVSGIDGVYAMRALRRDAPSTVVVLEQPDPYLLAVVTCALIRAVPDRDRFHIGLSTAPRFHQVFDDVAPLAFDGASQELARVRATRRVPPPQVFVPDLPSADELALELMWMFGSHGMVPVEIVPDPFRSVDRTMPVIVTRAYTVRERRRAWQADSVAAALERLSWATPAWIACDEDLALGDDGLLDALRDKHPELLARTMVVATETSADWMRRLVARRYEHVRVVVSGRNERR